MKTYICLTLAYIVLVVVLLVGWFMNIFDVIALVATDTFSLMFILRVIGIFVAPLGGVLGFF